MKLLLSMIASSSMKHEMKINARRVQLIIGLVLVRCDLENNTEKYEHVEISAGIARVLNRWRNLIFISRATIVNDRGVAARVASA